MTSLSTDDQAIIVVVCIFGGYPLLLAVTALSVFLRKTIYNYRFEKRWERLLEAHAEEDLAMLRYQISKDQKASTRVKFRALWERSIISFLWNCSQAFLTLVACYSYVQELYEAPDVPTAFLVLEAFLSIVFLLDMSLLYFLAADKIDHLLSPFPFFDWISVLPFFFFWGFGNPFLVGESNNSLLFLRSLRIFRAFRVVRLYRLIPIVVERDTMKAELLQVIVMICGLVYISVGAMQFFEDNLDPISGLDSNAPFPWHTSLYFMITTLTTVGYGDITPKTNPGRAVIIIFLLWSVSLIPYTVGKLRAMMEAVNKYDIVEYDGPDGHILVIGDLTGDELSLFLKEWYHDDQNHGHTRVAVVSVTNPGKDLKKTLQSGLGKQMVTYVKGSPLDEYVLLHRAKIETASFCLLLTKESHACTLTYLALKSLNKKMRVVVRVIDGLLQSHFPLDPGDVIIRPAEVRRTLSASSVLLPGASSLLPGLLFSLNEKDMVEVPTDSWKKEFMQSLSQEFYSFPGPPSLNGLTFGQAALMLYKAYRVILVAATAEVQLPGRVRKMVLLNPRSSITRIKEGAMLYVIAPDYSFILDLFGVSQWNPFGSLTSVIPSNVERLSRWQRRDENEDGEEGEANEDERLIVSEEGSGFTGMRVTMDPDAMVNFMKQSKDIDLVEEEDLDPLDLDGEKARREGGYFFQSLGAWNSKRDVSFYEHVVLGFRSQKGGADWESIYMLLDHLRPKNQVVFEPEDFFQQMHDLNHHLIFIGPAEGFLEIVGPLRLYHSKSHPVIVAIFDEDDPDLKTATKVARSFNDIYVVVGNGHDITTSFFAGVDRCGHICIAPKASSRYGEVLDDPYLVDAETVFTIRFVKRLFKKMRKLPPTFQVELFYHENTRFLDIDDEEYSGEGDQEGEESDCCCGTCKSCRQFCIDLAFCRQYKRWWRTFQTGAGSDLPPLEPVVGSGSAFFSSTLLRMLVSTFNGDGGVYELFLLLIRRARFPETLDYSATLRLIAVPQEFVEETFEDMFCAYASRSKPVILIGLYRTRHEEGKLVRYAVANPQPTFLREDDRVYALLNDQQENLMTSMYASMG